MARVYTKIGNVFSAKVSDTSKKYLQYIANDLTQLNSDVIRVFKKEYPIEKSPEISDIVKDEVDFYAHCVVKWGVKLGFWEKVGYSSYQGIPDVLFRDSGDYGDPKIKVSEKWWVWKINEEQKFVGKLIGVHRNAERGIVISPDNIVCRMRTGEYDFVYPGFE